jgi:6-phosphogluconolactonase
MLPASCGGGDLNSPTPAPSPTPGLAGRFVYAASATSGEIAEFSVAQNGSLVPLATLALPGGARTNAIAGDPLGRFVYVARAGGRGGIHCFAVDSTGLLQDVAGSPFDLDHQADFLTPEREGGVLWATRHFNLIIEAFTVDGATGALALAASTSFTRNAPLEPALRPDGRFLYVPTSLDVITFGADATTGRLTEAAPRVVAPDVVRSLAVDPEGAFLYLTTATPFTSDTLFLYEIDRTTGALTRVPGSALAPGFDPATANLRPDRVTFHSSGRFAYVADRPARTGAFSRGFWAFLAQASGALGPAVGPFTTPATAPFLVGDPSALALDPAGRFAYVTDATASAVSAFSIDQSTGALTAIGPPVPTIQAPTSLVVIP